MAYEVTLVIPDGVNALLECAKHGIPGPVFVEECSGTHVHAVIVADDYNGAIEEQLYSWYEENTHVAEVLRLG